MNRGNSAFPPDANGVEMSEAGGASNTNPASETRTAVMEPEAMSFKDSYHDSARPDKPEQPANWQAIGELARRLVIEMAKRREAEK